MEKKVKKSLLAEVYHLEAHTRRALDRKNKVLGKLETYKKGHENLLDSKNEEIQILQDKIVFFNKLFKSCMSHKKEIKDLKEMLKHKKFKMDLKEQIVNDLQDKIKNENTLHKALVAENKYLKEDNAKLLNTLQIQNDELLKVDAESSEKIKKLETELQCVKDVLSFTSESLKKENVGSESDKQNIAELEMKIKVIEDNYSELKVNFEIKENKIKELEVMIQNKNITNSKLNKQIEKLEAENSEIKEKSAFKESKLEQLAKVSDEQFKIALEKVEKENSDLRKEMLKVSKEENNKSVNALEADSDQADKNNSLLKKIETEKNNLAENLTFKVNEIEEANREKELLKEKIKNLESEQDNLKRERKYSEYLKSKIKKLEVERGNLKQKVSDIEKIRDEALNDSKTMEAKCMDVKKKNVNLEEELTKLKNEISEIEEEVMKSELLDKDDDKEDRKETICRESYVSMKRLKLQNWGSFESGNFSKSEVTMGKVLPSKTGRRRKSHSAKSGPSEVEKPLERSSSSSIVDNTIVAEKDKHNAYNLRTKISQEIENKEHVDEFVSNDEGMDETLTEYSAKPVPSDVDKVITMEISETTRNEDKNITFPESSEKEQNTHHSKRFSELQLRGLKVSKIGPIDVDKTDDDKTVKDKTKVDMTDVNKTATAEDLKKEGVKEETLNKLQKRGVGIKFVKQNEKVEEFKDQDTNCIVDDHQNEDDQTKEDKDVLSNITEEKNDLKETKINNISISDEVFVSVTSTSGKTMRVKKKDLQSIMSSQTIPKLMTTKQSNNYDCVECEEKFTSESALSNHSKIYHGLFTHFVPIKL